MLDIEVASDILGKAIENEKKWVDANREILNMWIIDRVKYNKMRKNKIYTRKEKAEFQVKASKLNSILFY